MKFWQKIFFGTFFIFIVVFDIALYILTSYAYDFNRQREIDSGIREQNAILSTLNNEISNTEIFYTYAFASKNEGILKAVIQPLADYYEQQGILMALLYHDSTIIYSSISEVTAIDATLLDLGGTLSKNVMDKKEDQKRYVFVASKIPSYPHLIFVYARDISQIDEFKANFNRLFIIINAAVLSVFGIAIFLLLKHLTRPITKLNKVTLEMADGAYEKRVSINRNDELGRLGQNFNRMADSVEENMVRLTKAAEDKQQFIDDLTHEMKTPLTSILGYSAYLQNVKSEETDRITALGHLHNSALRLKNLSGKLLEFTFLRGEGIEFQTVHIPALFKALTEMMSPSLISRNLKLKTLADLSSVQGDETLLLSLLTNLVENAAKASKSDDTITVRTYEEEGPVLEVKDTGYGMEKQEIEKITAPFYCVDKSRSRKFGGAGLGLSIVAQIVDLHKAKMEIDSSPGQGTTIRIRFKLDH